MAGSTQHSERLTRNNALLLLVDHQVGLYTGVRDIDILQLKHNIVALTLLWSADRKKSTKRAPTVSATRTLG